MKNKGRKLTLYVTLTEDECTWPWDAHKAPIGGVRVTMVQEGHVPLYDEECPECGERLNPADLDPAACRACDP